MNKAERKQAIIKREKLKDPTLTDEQAYEVYRKVQAAHGAIGGKNNTYRAFRDNPGLASKAGQKSTYRGFRDVPGLAKKASDKGLKVRWPKNDEKDA